MTNELLSLIIIAIWLKSGRGFNLCLIIIIYYITYIISDIATPEGLIAGISQVYFTVQIFIDLSILFLCLLLAYKGKLQSILAFCYGIVVFSSLALDGLRLIDEVSESYFLFELYDLRQQYSHALDLIFAVLGSGRGELINNLGLFIRVRRVYNRLININSDTQNKPL